MARKKKVEPTRYRVDRTKPLSNARRYEYLREVGVELPTGIGNQTDVVKGNALDAYIDDIVWRRAHPGEDPVCVF